MLIMPPIRESESIVNSPMFCKNKTQAIAIGITIAAKNFEIGRFSDILLNNLSHKNTNQLLTLLCHMFYVIHSVKFENK